MRIGEVRRQNKRGKIVDKPREKPVDTNCRICQKTGGYEFWRIIELGRINHKRQEFYCVSHYPRLDDMPILKEKIIDNNWCKCPNDNNVIWDGFGGGQCSVCKGYTF